MPSSIAPPSSQQQQKNIDVLRVAHVELQSGNIQGQVYRRLSPGAVAFASDRIQVQSHVSQQIREAILQQEQQQQQAPPR